MFFMKLNQKKGDKSHDVVDNNKNYLQAYKKLNLNCLYPNGHRMTNQMRWYKGSRDIGLKSDIAA